VLDELVSVLLAFKLRENAPLLAPLEGSRRSVTRGGRRASHP
jgi:hypothetical protein